jgi:hypothetical protein
VVVGEDEAVGLMMTPLPSPLCGSAPWSPKKKRNQGSLDGGPLGRLAGVDAHHRLRGLLRGKAEAARRGRRVPPYSVASVSATPVAAVVTRAAVQPLRLHRHHDEVRRQQQR